MLTLVHVLSATGSPTMDSAALSAIATSVSSAYNVSLSLAATLPDGSTIAAAAGFDDRLKGTQVSTASLYPSGSVTKLYTATAAMRLAEAGKLDLDAPFHTIVDPWLVAQGASSIKEQWGRDAQIEQVTVRQLLSMRGGIADYDDMALRVWTLAHTSDWLPSDYVRNVSKAFLFKPGAGGAYSGVSFILAGWVLCAASENCKTWSDLDQASLVRTAGLPLNETIFMHTGPCSKYSAPVVHQYFYAPGDRMVKAGMPGRVHRPPVNLTFDARADMVEAPSRAAPHSGRSTTTAAAGTTKNDHCKVHKGGPQGSWWSGITFKGSPIKRMRVETGGAEACCASADERTLGASYWTFTADATGGSAGECAFYSYNPGGYSRSSKATSGRTDIQLSQGDFVDLFDYSCLNGWTMGNIAATPADVTRFYHALFQGQIISEASLAQMMAWKPLTTGFEPGMPYGLGLMYGEIRLPLATHTCANLEQYGCECHLFVGCALKVPYYSHAGLDYGSGMELLGWITKVNVSFALASNTGEMPMGMNSSLGVMENERIMYASYCPFLGAVLKAAIPGFPDTKC